MVEVGQLKFDPKAFDERIARLAEPSLSAGEPCLISRLGIDLGEDLRLMRSALNLTLAEYIREHLGEVYDVLEIKRNTSAIWPKGKAYVKTAEAYDPPSAGSKKAKRFKGWFWQAFSVPLAAGDRFYDPDAREIKVVENGKPEQNWKIIPRDKIYSDDQGFDFKLVQKNIRRWLKDNGLREEEFLEDVEEPARSQPSGRSLLEHMLEALDKKQMQSVTLTLDAVAALSRVRV